MPAISQLAAYYLDCISRDRDDKVSAYLTNAYGNVDYGQVFSRPEADVEDAAAYSADARALFAKVRRSPASLQLVLGYPLSIRWFSGRNGARYGKVEPIFYQLYELDRGAGHPVLSDEILRLNPEAILGLSGFDGQDLTSAMLSLYEETGLDGALADRPDLWEAAASLHTGRPEWRWQEKPVPEDLNQMVLKQATEATLPAGIYNTAAFFCMERSKFTQGLERELADLQKMPEVKAKASVLSDMAAGAMAASQPPAVPLIEPLPLNEEQREAVRQALSARLTTVTGPPGTGKSQVVASIIVNAVYQGQKVLFSSKNNKAVDVVLERVNSLSNRAVMIRLGKDSDGHDLRTRLLEYINGLLSTASQVEEQSRYQSCRERQEEILARLAALRLQEVDVIGRRNQMDKLERDCERWRDAWGDKRFAEYGAWSAEQMERLEMQADRLEVSVSSCNQNNQGFWVRIFWPFARKGRWQNLAGAVQEAFATLKEVGLDLAFAMDETGPDLAAAEKNIAAIRERIQAIQQIRLYFTLLHSLPETGDLFAIARRIKSAEEELQRNSFDLWDAWLRLLPGRLTAQDRRALSEYSTVLRQIMELGEAKTLAARRVWAKYYELLPSISNILPCWAVTSLSVKSRVPFEPGFFDLVVIDEASQCDIASALPLLFRAKRAVVIGDVKQLRHISSLTMSDSLMLQERYGLGNDGLSWNYREKSLFELAQGLVAAGSLVDLRDHHRSHADIVAFSNKYFYDGKLRVVTRYDKLNSLPGGPAVRWVHQAGSTEAHRNGGSYNEAEAKAVYREVKRVADAGYRGSVGVVSPFRAQVNRIRDLIAADQELEDRLRLREFMVETVHRFQGDERDVMIFSPVVATGISRGSAYFLEQTGNLFNVSLTRARAALVVVGDKEYCGCGDLSPKYLREFVTYQDQLGRDNQALAAADFDYGPQYPAVSSSIMVSDWEKILYRALYKEGIRTQPQYQVMQYSLDLALFCGDRKLDIEVDGEHYHRDWDGELCRRDQLRNRRLIEMGWDVMRFWVYEIRDNMPGCLARVREWESRE